MVKKASSPGRIKNLIDFLNQLLGKPHFQYISIFRKKVDFAHFTSELWILELQSKSNQKSRNFQLDTWFYICDGTFQLSFF